MTIFASKKLSCLSNKLVNKKLSYKSKIREVCTHINILIKHTLPPQSLLTVKDNNVLFTFAYSSTLSFNLQLLVSVALYC